MYRMVNVFRAAEHLMNTLIYQLVNLDLTDCILSDFPAGNFSLCVPRLDYWDFYFLLDHPEMISYRISMVRPVSI